MKIFLILIVFHVNTLAKHVRTQLPIVYYVMGVWKIEIRLLYVIAKWDFICNKVSKIANSVHKNINYVVIQTMEFVLITRIKIKIVIAIKATF